MRRAYFEGGGKERKGIIVIEACQARIFKDNIISIWSTALGSRTRRKCMPLSSLSDVIRTLRYLVTDIKDTFIPVRVDYAPMATKNLKRPSCGSDHFELY